MRTIIISAILALAVATPLAAHAQNGAQPSFDQYPSFIEMSANAQGMQTVLRCGYALVGNQHVIDPGYQELTTLNQSTGQYLRMQRIDGKVIATTTSIANNGRFILEVAEPNGMITAKECINDVNTDSIQGCVPAQPFMPATDVLAQDQNIAAQCTTFMNKATATLDPATYNLQKTQLFKAGLRQKVATLQAP